MSHSSKGGSTSNLVAITTIMMFLHHFVENLRVSHVTSNDIFLLACGAQKPMGTPCSLVPCKTQSSMMAAQGV